MSNLKISEMTSGGTLDGTELLVAVQSSANRKVTLSTAGTFILGVLKAAANTFTLGPNVFQAGANGNVALIAQMGSSPTKNAFEIQKADNTMVGGFGLGGQIVGLATTPTQVSSNQGGYDPGVIRYWTRITTDQAGRTFAGWLAPSPLQNEERRLVNAGSYSFILQHQNGNASSANRFYVNTLTDVTVSPGDIILIWYDVDSGYWRVVI